MGTITEISQKVTSRGIHMLGVLLFDGNDAVRATWFNQNYLRSKLKRGQRVILSGKAKLRGMRWEFSHPKIQWIDAQEQTPTGEILPVYRLSEGITQGQMRYIMRTAIPAYVNCVDEVFPEAALEKYNLLGIERALLAIHFPATTEDMLAARRRFVFQELFILQLGLALRRQSLIVQFHSPALPISAKIDARIRRLFPFAFTEGQTQAIKEICADLGRTIPMNRLLQGDVGSGKTVVALYAMLLTVAHGYQAVIMAPTEVLARQHARTLGRMLEKSQVHTALLTGGMTTAERSHVLKGIRTGQIQVVIGTQAVLSDAVEFAKLGLVVIDEQHKFGVRQRSGLKQAGENPHYLVMTATPIPRTVSMTLYGDLDVSTLRESPPGRQSLYTYLGDNLKRDKWWDFVRRKLNEGRQAYVIVPLVEESETWDASHIGQAFDELALGPLKGFRIGILHGRMPNEEKEEMMVAFAEGRIQVLLSTSVVEVGIDVANATVMTILGAERFGLAQLHQLRGRVHRGQYPGYCTLIPDVEQLSDESLERLSALVKSTDGFELAEVDFKLRGPGDIFGTKQHGFPPLRIADLQRDAEIVGEARQAAQEFVLGDPGLQHVEHAKLRKMVWFATAKFSI